MIHPIPIIHFIEALKRDGISLICEVKKSFAFQRNYARYFPYIDIVQKGSEKSGADRISVLTEPKAVSWQQRNIYRNKR